MNKRHRRSICRGHLVTTLFYGHRVCPNIWISSEYCSASSNLTIGIGPSFTASARSATALRPGRMRWRAGRHRSCRWRLSGHRPPR